MKYLKGTRFEWNHTAWLVLERNGNFVLLQGDQPGIQRFYTTTNVTINGNDEDCRPYVTGLTPDSMAFNRDKVTEFYHSEIARLERQELVRAEAAEAQNVKDRARVAKIAKVREANLLKKDAEVELKELIYSKNVSELAKSKKAKALVDKISICEYLITTLV